jgi:hypothetical protein
MKLYIGNRNTKEQRLSSRAGQRQSIRLGSPSPKRSFRTLKLERKELIKLHSKFERSGC